MKREVLKALNGSIEKWERIVAGTGKDVAQSNCPLCTLFFNGDCEGCPIEKAATYECRTTPYEKWIDHHTKNHTWKVENIGSKIECRWCRKYAEEELKFLKSLLPKQTLR